MNIKEAVNYFSSHRAAIYTPSKETYDALMEELELQRYRWSNGDNPTRLPMAYTVEDGNICVSIGPRGLLFSNKSEYIKDEYEIVEVNL